MTINIQKAIQWFRNKKGAVTYSMEQRDGEFSYDCSSAVYYALRFAGAISAGWAVNTEYMHDWLKKNGYVLIAENQSWNAQAGDVFIWGKRGQSAGAGGHTGMFIDENNIIHCNYANNGISINDHDERWAYAGRPYFYVYRYVGKKITGWIKDNSGWYYQNENERYPTATFKEIEGIWYYFGSDGYMYSNQWLKHTDDKWYYFNNDGAMVKGWWLIADKWYYFNNDGSMFAGWTKYKEKWYYLHEKNGEMLSDSFVESNGSWYYLKSDGTMATNATFGVGLDGIVTTE